MRPKHYLVIDFDEGLTYDKKLKSLCNKAHKKLYLLLICFIKHMYCLCKIMQMPSSQMIELTYLQEI